MPHFAVACLQLSLGLEGNLPAILAELRSVRRRTPWVRMAVLSELAVHGTSLAHAEAVGGPTELAFVELAKELGIWILPGSLFQTDGGAVYNVAPVISPAGEVVARHRKLYPFLPYERGVTPGTSHTVFEVEEVGRFGVSICYDMWFPETTRSLAWLGAEIVLHPTLTNTIDRGAELAIARAAATSNQLFFLDVNGAGHLAVGKSGFYGPGGEILHEAGAGHEVVVFDLDFGHLRRVRERGWHGLGQVLKSFRDGPAEFPAYGAGRAASLVLESLGPLRRPGQTSISSGDE